MNKFLIIVIILVLLIVSLSGCKKENNEASKTSSSIISQVSKSSDSVSLPLPQIYVNTDYALINMQNQQNNSYGTGCPTIFVNKSNIYFSDDHKRTFNLLNKDKTVKKISGDIDFCIEKNDMIYARESNELFSACNILTISKDGAEVQKFYDGEVYFVFYFVNNIVFGEFKNNKNYIKQCDYEGKNLKTLFEYGLIYATDKYILYKNMAKSELYLLNRLNGTSEQVDLSDTYYRICIKDDNIYYIDSNKKLEIYNIKNKTTKILIDKEIFSFLLINDYIIINDNKKIELYDNNSKFLGNMYNGNRITSMNIYNNNLYFFDDQSTSKKLLSYNLKNKNIETIKEFVIE
jgi:hypothetical protein